MVLEKTPLYLFVSGFLESSGSFEEFIQHNAESKWPATVYSYCNRAFASACSGRTTDTIAIVH